MYFTREALEQASGETAARHCAGRYWEAPQIADLCCGIGGDLLQLAALGNDVAAVDRDPLRLRMAECNAEVYGVRDRIHFVQHDVQSWQPLPSSLVFFDPARRSGGKRINDPERYEPPLSLVDTWLRIVDGVGVKVAPGIDYEALPWQNCEVEVISVAGEVKETVLWLGRLAHGTRTATLLPAGDTLKAIPTAAISVEVPRAFLYEPDGAVIRAHLVEQLAALIGATKIDPEIAFLSSDHRVETPFARSFRVDEVLPFNLKRLRQWLRERKIGEVVVKKRGSPIDPDTFGRQLRPEGPGSAVVVLTRAKGKPVSIICDVSS
jgi:SAM-dependent methyltransferase